MFLAGATELCDPWSHSQKSNGFLQELAVNSIESPKAIKIGARLHARYNAEAGRTIRLMVIKRMVSGEPANIERWLTEEDLRP
jgi:hypothetical protein